MSENISIYATRDRSTNEAISLLWEQKFGAVMDKGHGDNTSWPYLATNGSKEGTRLGEGMEIKKTKEISLAELEAMPDYVEPEETINVDGRDWSLSTVKEALKRHADY